MDDCPPGGTEYDENHYHRCPPTDTAHWLNCHGADGTAEKLPEIARRKRTASMCAESLFWRCHRRMVSDYLVANGETIQHIMPTGELRGD
jgi:hypothetical protein